MRLLCELVIIVSQALTAVWFYKLFRHLNETAAWAVGIWGMINSGVIMVSAISMGTAMELAQVATLAQADKIVLIQLLSSVSIHAWGVGGLFFGLWLLPMGYVVITSKRMPVWLGRILIMGGAGYLLSTFIQYAGINHPVSELLPWPATVGEFWMIGYLLLYGIRPANESPAPATT
jgi:hypothetical protein